MRGSRIWLSRVFLCLVCVVLGAPALVLGSGYQIREHSVAAIGSAFAGVHTGGHDLADVFYNPATLMRSQGRQAQMGASTLLFDATFSLESATNLLGAPIPGNPGGANIAPRATIPSLYVGMDSGKDTRIGLAVNAPWGLESRQPEGWVGRYHALNSKMTSLNVTPMVAHRFQGGTSLALGLQFQQIESTLGNALDFGLLGAKAFGGIPGNQDGRVELKADDWGTGFVLGLMHESDAKTRWGMSYRSAVSLDLSGDARFTLDSAGTGQKIVAATGAFRNCGAAADLKTPAILGFGFSRDIGPRWTLMADAVRTFWGKFEELRITFDNPAQADAVTREEWNDTWFLSLGGKYRANEHWTWRVGAAQDEGPVEDDRRIPRIPTSSSRWLALGATWQASKDTTVDFGWTHLWYDKAPIRLSIADPNNQAAGNLFGAYETKLDILGLSVQSRF